GSAPIEVRGTAASHAPVHHAANDDFVRAGALYRLMSDAEKARLIGNIAARLPRVSREDIAARDRQFPARRSRLWRPA
ncbi:MAG TPA: catalase-related domain-containing protein, partial [Candidatus Binataceae bacterium]|nr:catalase-related domain-containing protein [Candidatus Binataceae bacterium]